jgi:hypothetical protein
MQTKKTFALYIAYTLLVLVCTIRQLYQLAAAEINGSGTLCTAAPQPLRFVIGRWGHDATGNSNRAAAPATRGWRRADRCAADTRAHICACEGRRWQVAKFANLICQSVGGHNFLFYQIFKDDNLIWQTLEDARLRSLDVACKERHAKYIKARLAGHLR